MPLALVIEDDAVQRLATCLVLKGEGFHVKEADDGDRGLAQARAFRPDIVICDLLLPGLDGWDLIAALRADPDLWDVPVVVLTALTQRSELRRAMTSGADDVLGKPVQAHELCEAVESLMARRDALRQHYTRMLRRSLGESLEQEKQQLALRYEKRLAEELGRGAAGPARQWRGAVVVALEVGPAAVAGALTGSAGSAGSAGALALTQGSARLRDLLQLFGAAGVFGAENGLVAVFADAAEPRNALAQAARALAAIESSVAQPLDLAIGVALGTVLAVPLPDPAEGDARLQVAAGPAVAAAAMLRQRARQLEWRIAVSPALGALDDRLTRVGRQVPAGAGPAAFEVTGWTLPGAA